VASSITPELKQNCNRCSRDLPAGALACPECHSLVYSGELQQLSEAAKALEAKNQFRAARDEWVRTLAFLPRDSEQAQWIRNHSRQLLEKALDSELPLQGKTNPWVKRLGPLGPIAILLAKSKGLLLAVFKLKFLLSFVSFLGVDWALYGVRFGTGFTLLILIHEMGHFIDVKRRGLPAEMPVFLPGLGAYVRWQALGVSSETRAAVSLAGPLAGWFASFACVFIFWKTGDPLYASLARASAMLNVLNLIPVWILDGGQAISALSKTDRIVLLTACLALWLFIGEGVFFLVAGGAAWRLFTKDMAPHSSIRTTAYYVAVLLFLAIVLRVIPGEGFTATPH
jgi:Zn-dependent protease